MPSNNPSIAYSITIRAQYANEAGMLGTISSAIGEAEGDIGAIDTVSSSRTTMVRDITVNARDIAHGEKIAKKVESYMGPITVHELIELALGHAFQHLRQSYHYMPTIGIEPDRPLAREDYKEVSVPKDLF